MTDTSDQAVKNAAMARLRKADARVRKHEAERRELADALVAARLAGWRPLELDEASHYDRNHIGRILKAAREREGAAKPED